LLPQAIVRNAAGLELNRAKGMEPASKTGELALLFIRLYRSRSVSVGNDHHRGIT
jgi:hypothetical protein